MSIHTRRVDESPPVRIPAVSRHVGRRAKPASPNADDDDDADEEDVEEEQCSGPCDHDAGGDMVGCQTGINGTCPGGEWFHPRCLEPESLANNEDDDWLCPVCRATGEKKLSKRPLRGQSGPTEKRTRYVHRADSHAGHSNADDSDEEEDAPVATIFCAVCQSSHGHMQQSNDGWVHPACNPHARSTTPASAGQLQSPASPQKVVVSAAPHAQIVAAGANNAVCLLARCNPILQSITLRCGCHCCSACQSLLQLEENRTDVGEGEKQKRKNVDRKNAHITHRRQKKKPPFLC